MCLLSFSSLQEALKHSQVLCVTAQRRKEKQGGGGGGGGGGEEGVSLSTLTS